MFFANKIFNSEERKKFFQKNESKFEDKNFGQKIICFFQNQKN